MSANKAVGIIVLIVVVCAWAFIALTDEPRLQLGIANGSYSNRCCGTVTFANGVMSVANQRVSYVVERDKVGRYVLPSAYVGATETGFVIRSNAHALKLRLDDSTLPQHVLLFDDGPGNAYPFARRNGS